MFYLALYCCTVGSVRFGRLALVTLLSALYAAAVSGIPTPHSDSAFWVANLSAPWAVMPFVSGALQPNRVAAVIAGVLADLAAVVGFYWKYLPTGRLGAFNSMSGWLDFTKAWLVAAVVAGAACGVLGHLWLSRRSVLAGAALSVPFLLEPFVWPLYEGRYKGPVTIWLVELAAGLVVLALMVVRPLVLSIRDRRGRPSAA